MIVLFDRLNTYVDAIFNDIETGTQAEVAADYSRLILLDQNMSGGHIDWPLVNDCIQRRWTSKSALLRVKTMAWKIVEARKPPGDGETPLDAMWPEGEE